MLISSYNFRTMQNGVLELVDYISAGGVLNIYYQNVYTQYPYDAGNGQIAYATNGFVFVKKITAGPLDANRLTKDRIKQLQELPGGLFVSGIVLNPMDAQNSQYQCTPEYP